MEPDRKWWFNQLDLTMPSWRPRLRERKTDTLPHPVWLCVWLIRVLQKEGHPAEVSRQDGWAIRGYLVWTSGLLFSSSPSSAPFFSLSSSFLLLLHLFFLLFQDPPALCFCHQHKGVPTGPVYPAVVSGLCWDHSCPTSQDTCHKNSKGVLTCMKTDVIVRTL